MVSLQPAAVFQSLNDTRKSAELSRTLYPIQAISNHHPCHFLGVLDTEGSCCGLLSKDMDLFSYIKTCWSNQHHSLLVVYKAIYFKNTMNNTFLRFDTAHQQHYLCHLEADISDTYTHNGVIRTILELFSNCPETVLNLCGTVWRKSQESEDSVVNVQE